MTTDPHVVDKVDTAQSIVAGLGIVTDDKMQTSAPDVETRAAVIWCFLAVLGASVAGRVVDAVTGEPVPRAEVAVVTLDPAPLVRALAETEEPAQHRRHEGVEGEDGGGGEAGQDDHGLAVGHGQAQRLAGFDGNLPEDFFKSMVVQRGLDLILFADRNTAGADDQVKG